MKTLLRFTGLLICLLSLACGSSSPAAPSSSSTSTSTTTTTAPPATTFTLSGTITSAAGGGLNGATITIADGPNAGKATQTSAAGAYSFSGLTQSGFTVTISASGFVSVVRAITLTTNTTLTLSLLPAQVFTASGTGDNVFTIPTYVTRVRVDATYVGNCQNFIVRISSSVTSLINIIIGTCSVADTRSPFSGTYAINSGGTVTITSSTGVNWTFTELRN